MNDMMVANTIKAQLGGGMFTAMTGAKNFVGNQYSLFFKIGRNAKSVTHVEIMLNGKDLYDMNFYRIRLNKGVPVRTITATVNDVYFDMLQDIFTEKTGLYTHF